MFSYVWLHFKKCFRKIFSGVWLCSWKYHKKHIFYLLLTFSHIFSVAKRIYNIIHSSIHKHKQNPEKKNHQIRSHFLTVSRLPNKYVISFIPQYRNTDKTQKKKKKKNHQIRSNWEKKEEREATRFDEGRDRAAEAKARSARCFARLRSARRRDCDWWRDLCPFARSRDRSFSLSFSLCASVSSSLCASQFRKPFEVKIGTEMNFRGQSFFFTVKWKWFPENSIFKPTKQPILRKMISRSILELYWLLN